MLRFDRKQENSVKNHISNGKKNKLKINTEEFNSKHNLTLKTLS